MIFLPLDIVALLPHQPTEMFFAFGFLHRVVDSVYQFDLPALAFHSRVIFSRRYTFALVFEMRSVECDNSVPLTYFVRQLTHRFQRELV